MNALVTFEVSKFNNCKVNKELHLANIFFIFVTSDVFTPIIDKEVKEEQP